MSDRRLPCQCCGKHLTPRRDGLAKPHGRHGACRGVGYRLARWPVGQWLAHHSGAVWEVIADQGGHDYTRNGDYRLRCVRGTAAWRGGEKVGNEITAHGEYMHRHGWTPIEPAQNGGDQ